MTRTEMFEQLVAKLTADNERLVSDLRNLDELFRNATDQSNRATQALVNERAEVARLQPLAAAAKKYVASIDGDDRTWRNARVELCDAAEDYVALANETPTA